MWPSPPKPATPTLSPCFTLEAWMGDQTVTPAQSRGGTRLRSAPAGMWMALRSGTTTRLE